MTSLFERTAGQAGPDYDNLTFRHGEHPLYPNEDNHPQGHQTIFAHHPEHGDVGRLHYRVLEHPEWTGWEPSTVHVTMMHVEPDHQRRGVASQLMNHLENHVHPDTLIDHGERRPDGQEWARAKYKDPSEMDGFEKSRTTKNGRPWNIQTKKPYRMPKKTARDWDEFRRVQDSQQHAGHHVGVVHNLKLGHFSPKLRVFTHTCGLDHRLWGADEKLKPEVRSYILHSITVMWSGKYKDWAKWARVYFAGSEASEWTSDNLEGNNDFDVLVGVDYEKFRASNPQYRSWSNQEITDQMNHEFRDYNGPVWLPIRTTEDVRGSESWHHGSSFNPNRFNNSLTNTTQVSQQPNWQSDFLSTSHQSVAISNLQGSPEICNDVDPVQLSASFSYVRSVASKMLDPRASVKIACGCIIAPITSGAPLESRLNNTKTCSSHRAGDVLSANEQTLSFMSTMIIDAAQAARPVANVFEGSYVPDVTAHWVILANQTSNLPQPIYGIAPPTQSLPDGWYWTGFWDRTSYCNPDSYDIRKIKPYAAYDVGKNEWVVRPPHLPHWSLSSLPGAVQKVLRATDTLARGVLKLDEPERTQQGAMLFDSWHSDRSRAFGPNGEGWWDIANLREKWLDQAGLWAQIVDCKHRFDEGLGAADADWSNMPKTAAFMHERLDEVGRKEHPNVDHYQSGGMGHMPGDSSRSVVGFVPTQKLFGYEGNETHDKRVVHQVRDDIRSGKGITNPAMMVYDHKNRWAYLGEGNHRLEGATEAGARTVPVRFVRGDASHAKKNGIGGPMHTDTVFNDRDPNYVPSDIHPYHFLKDSDSIKMESSSQQFTLSEVKRKVSGYAPEDMGPFLPNGDLHRKARFSLEPLDLSRVKHLHGASGADLDSQSNINDGYYSEMHDSMKGKGRRKVPPVVATEHPDGEIELHDGWHRGAIALREGQTHLPAFVHRPETTKTAGANGEDYKGLTFSYWKNYSEKSDHPEWLDGNDKHDSRSFIGMMAHHPDHPHSVGSLEFSPIKYGENDKEVHIHGIKVPEEHQRRGVAKALMNEIERRYSDSPINHGLRTEQGKDWAKSQYGHDSVKSERPGSSTQYGDAPYDGGWTRGGKPFKHESKLATIQMMRPSELAGHHQRDDLDEPWNRHKIDSLKDSINQYGYETDRGDPIRVGYHPDKGPTLTNGNKRIKALTELGYDVPVPVHKMASIPDEYAPVVHAVRKALSDDLLKPEYRNREGRKPTSGHCYAASEATYHLLGGKDAGLTPVNIKHEGDSHWFLRDSKSRVIDPTHDQFEGPVPYEKGRGAGFLTKEPSRRAQTIMDRVSEQHKIAMPWFNQDENVTRPRAKSVKRVGFAGFVADRQWVRDHVDGPRASNQEADRPDHLDEHLSHFVQAHSEHASTTWDKHGERKDIDLHQPIYATQSHVSQYHMDRYRKNPKADSWALHNDPDPVVGDDYQGHYNPLFVTHRGRLHAVEGHHRVGAALQDGRDSIPALHYDLDKHPIVQNRSGQDCPECHRHEAESHAEARTASAPTTTRLEAAHGSHDLSKLFGDSPTAPTPWPSAGRRKDVKDYEEDKVARSITHPHEFPVEQVDPRHLRSTQPSIIRGAVQHYMDHPSGRTYGEDNGGDKRLGNDIPRIYHRHSETGDQQLILSGHHRAAAALIKGEPLNAIVIHGGWGGPRK